MLVCHYSQAHFSLQNVHKVIQHDPIPSTGWQLLLILSTLSGPKSIGLSILHGTFSKVMANQKPENLMTIRSNNPWLATNVGLVQN